MKPYCPDCAVQLYKTRDNSPRIKCPKCGKFAALKGPLVLMLDSLRSVKAALLANNCIMIEYDSRWVNMESTNEARKVHE